MSSRLVVLDTNVLVSAGIKAGGLEWEVLDLVLEDELILVTCPGVVLEYRDVLKWAKFRKFGFPPRWLENLLKLSHHRLQDPPAWPLAGPDPDDLLFLSLAHDMGGTLVTGNLKDYPIRFRRGTPVLNAKEFLDDFHKQV